MTPAPPFAIMEGANQTMEAKPMSLPADQDAIFRAHLEELGAEQVRMMVSTGSLPLTHHSVAIRWLADLDREAAQADKSLRAEEIEISRSSKDAAWAASCAAERAATAAERAASAAERSVLEAKRQNTRAAIALIIAIASIIITALSVRPGTIRVI